MTDLRTRLADALLKAGLDMLVPVTEAWNVACDFADVLLSLPDIASVDLPAGADVGQGWRQFRNVVVGPDGDIRDEGSSPAIKHNAATARAHAAALLAAANTAEVKP